VANFILSRNNVMALLTIAITMWLPAATYGSDEKTTKKAGAATAPKVQEAMDCFNRREFEQSLELLQEAKVLNPDFPPARVMLAKFFANAKMMIAFRSSLERTIVELPNDPEAYIILGNVALGEQRLTEAQLLFELGASLAENSGRTPKRMRTLFQHANSGLAAVAEAREEWETAAKYLRNLLEINSKDAFAMQRLGRVMFLLGKTEEAVDLLRSAELADKRFETPEVIMSVLSERCGNFRFAERYMAEALQVRPNDYQTELAAARLSINVGKLEQATKFAKNAEKMAPKAADPQILLGLIARYRKDYKKAAKHFQSALLVSPNNFSANDNLALVLCEQKSREKQLLALEYAQLNARRVPRSTKAAATLGWVWLKLGQIDNAEIFLREATTGEELDASTAYYLANVAVKQDQIDNAKRLLKLSLKTKQPFVYRQDVNRMLADLDRKR